MAGIHFQPPEKFDFKQPDEWPRWLKRFEQFRIASGLSEEGEQCQVNRVGHQYSDTINIRTLV